MLIFPYTAAQQMMTEDVVLFDVFFCGVNPFS
jgi:hypothetical protein